jgi:hypothetical protein
MAKKFNINKFNSILLEHNQILRATKITGTEIVLSNGVILTSKKDVRLCKNRVMNGHSIWKSNFDKLYGKEAAIRLQTETMCRSLTSKQGGISCQAKHKNILKQNLNTGVPWNKGLKGIYPYSNPCSNETKKKISISNSGTKNGMFGKKMSTEQKQHLSKLMKEKILSREFTPNSNNRNSHWQSSYKSKNYRSSWEALYQYFDNKAEYETLRIPYIYESKQYIYIIDFVNHNTKIVTEVKPVELTKDKKTQAKISAANEWCNTNNYTFFIADKEYFMKKEIPQTFKDFDKSTEQKIRKLYSETKK